MANNHFYIYTKFINFTEIVSRNSVFGLFYPMSKWGWGMLKVQNFRFLSTNSILMNKIPFEGETYYQNGTSKAQTYENVWKLSLTKFAQSESSDYNHLFGGFSNGKL